MIHKNFSKLICLFIAMIFSCIPFNMIIGSKAAWFSCSSMVIPALSYHTSLLYVILSIFTKGLLSFNLCIFYVIHRLPQIAAALALQKRNWKLYLLLPSIAMIFFCIHPVGKQVFYYSWYWFIPMILYFFVQDNLYIRALSASFIAHAVGSVIWLYGGNIPVEAWTLLMPIVPIERVIVAIGMVSFVYIFKALSCLNFGKASA